MKIRFYDDEAMMMGINTYLNGRIISVYGSDLRARKWSEKPEKTSIIQKAGV